MFVSLVGTPLKRQSTAKLPKIRIARRSGDYTCGRVPALCRARRPTLEYRNCEQLTCVRGPPLRPSISYNCEYLSRYKNERKARFRIHYESFFILYLSHSYFTPRLGSTQIWPMTSAIFYKQGQRSCVLGAAESRGGKF